MPHRNATQHTTLFGFYSYTRSAPQSHSVRLRSTRSAKLLSNMKPLKSESRYYDASGAWRASVQIVHDLKNQLNGLNSMHVLPSGWRRQSDRRTSTKHSQMIADWRRRIDMTILSDRPPLELVASRKRPRQILRNLETVKESNRRRDGGTRGQL